VSYDNLEGSKEGLKWNLKDLTTLEEVLKITPGRDAVVQAGGNLGVFPKRLAEEFKAVYTFEPDPDHFLVMCRNAPEKNIIRFQAAIGEQPTLINTVHGNERGRTHEGVTHVKGVGIIPTVRLDDLHLVNCNLIYLDIEGYELFALRGAAETIKRCKPVIVVELNINITRYGFKSEDVRNFIISLGYTRKLRMRSDEIFVPED